MEQEIDKNDNQEQKNYADKLVTNTSNTNINTNVSQLENPKKNKM